MNILMIINGAAYGQDATYNAVRLAASMAKRDGVSLRIFLMGDGVTVAMAGQKTPDGYYKLDRMLSVVSRHSGQIGCCGTCMDARGITQATRGRRPDGVKLADPRLPGCPPGL